MEDFARNEIVVDASIVFMDNVNNGDDDDDDAVPYYRLFFTSAVCNIVRCNSMFFFCFVMSLDVMMIDDV